MGGCALRLCSSTAAAKLNLLLKRPSGESRTTLSGSIAREKGNRRKKAKVL